MKINYAIIKYLTIKYRCIRLLIEINKAGAIFLTES